ncbi:IlvD/Edd family dehydratase, partial [Streptomyces sp. NPDC051940]|uniref:IlvD/Edd family dehydratase n=1 Tax=Streptomyces sp. NPDC051940 TaxID=3155675 RepID=UPI0034447A65
APRGPGPTAGAAPHGPGPTAAAVPRSRAWFAGDTKNGFVARHHLRATGHGSWAFDGRPVVGICQTASDLTPCNRHLTGLAEQVRRGVLRAGGLPLEFPVFSPGEPFLRPSSMMYRNLMAIDVEESLRANPLDAVVLMTGCDKTTPAALMGAASADLPAVVLTGGPMLNGRFRGRAVGSGTDVWRMTEELRAGRIGPEAFAEFESCLNRSAGHCMTMGTASTMACVAEALGMALPGTGALPAADSRRAVLAEETGALAVELARTDLRPSRIMTREAFENAITVSAAIGGSTNAVLHLLALAGRLGVPLELDDFDAIARRVPLLADVMPSGRLLMEEFAYAGGVPALVTRLRGLLHDGPVTVTGRSLTASEAEVYDDSVIRPLTDPVQPPGAGLAVLRGSLAPGGAVVKPSAANPALLVHEGPALVFDSLEEYAAAADDPALDVSADTVLVVRGMGPRGYPGMPEAGNLPLPRKLLDAGVTDLVRISDARMSGTAYGTCVLHVAPESAVGGPLALVRTGDRIRLDVPGRRLDLLVGQEELAERRAAWTPPPPLAGAERGWTRLHVEHVLQADRGCDLDFLTGSSGHAVPRRAF